MAFLLKTRQHNVGVFWVVARVLLCGYFKWLLTSSLDSCSGVLMTEWVTYRSLPIKMGQEKILYHFNNSFHT